MLAKCFLRAWNQIFTFGQLLSETKKSKQQNNIINYWSNLKQRKEKQKIKENKAKNGFRKLIRPHISHGTLIKDHQSLNWTKLESISSALNKKRERDREKWMAICMKTFREHLKKMNENDFQIKMF